MGRPLEARGGLTIEYPQLQIGNIFVIQGRYEGTQDDLRALQELSQTPEFKKEHPNHAVFFYGREKLGALPLDPSLRGTEQYKAMNAQITAKRKERGIPSDALAIIRTGLPPAAPAPEPVFIPFIPVASSAPTR